MQVRTLFIAGIASIAMSCGPSVSGPQDNPDGGGSGSADARDPGSFADAPPPEPCTKMDIVFIVDDSGSMAEEQNNLATNFPLFVDVLNNYRNDSGEELDYRLAVTTTGRDVDYVIDPGIPPIPPIPFSENGDNGVFRQDCGMSRRWLERTDPNVASTFACAAQVGTGGPSLEMPLLTTQMALGDRIADGTNAGFLREDALLALVVLTDEDDCSRPDNNFSIVNDGCDSSIPQIMDTSLTLDFLDTLKDDRQRWATAVIAGPGPGTCSSEFGEAFEATRLKQFVGETGENAVFSSICEGDLAGALNDALETFEAACESLPPVL